MLERSAAIPAPEPDDADDVAVALETASALWGIGEKEEAIRRVRRAAEGAEQAGNDLRAVKLARSAADLASALQAEALAPGESMPPPPVAPIADSAARPAPMPSVRPHPPPPSRTPQPFAASSSPSSSAAALQASAAPSRRPPPPSARVRPGPPPLPPEAMTPPPPPARTRSLPPPLPQEPPAVTAATAPAPTPTPPPASERKPAAETPAPAPTAPTTTPTTTAPTTTRATTTTTTPATTIAATPAPAVPPAAAESESDQGPDVWHAVRVSVKPSARDPNLFILRRLEAQSAAPRGTQEALIVVLDPTSDLMGAPIARTDGGSRSSTQPRRR